MLKGRIRNDIILILSLLSVACISLAIILSLRVKKNLVAKVSVRNEVVEVIDLSKKEESDYHIQGIKGIVHIHTHDGAIAVVESNCPHQDCVHMGYIRETNRPIICAYNAVSIVIEGGDALNDVELGR